MEVFKYYTNTNSTENHFVTNVICKKAVLFLEKETVGLILMGYLVVH